MASKCYRSLIYQSTEPAVIVLEDLNESGFISLHAPDDYETSKMIFHRLAVFHAATFYLMENVRKSILFQEEILFFFFFYFILFLRHFSPFHLFPSARNQFVKLRLFRLPYARLNSGIILQTQLEDFQEPHDGKRMAGFESTGVY